MADMTDGFVKSTESTFGKPHHSRETVRNARRVVVKVNTLQHTALQSAHGAERRRCCGEACMLSSELHPVCWQVTVSDFLLDQCMPSGMAHVQHPHG